MHNYLCHSTCPGKALTANRDYIETFVSIRFTAGFRAQYDRVLLFDPANAKSSAYNPLLEVCRGEWEVRDVQNIADSEALARFYTAVIQGMAVQATDGANTDQLNALVEVALAAWPALTQA